jgi:hypothetical protein
MCNATGIANSGFVGLYVINEVCRLARNSFGMYVYSKVEFYLALFLPAG